MRRLPAPALFPSDPSLGEEADRWISWLDAKVGPATRLALFHEVLADPDHAVQIFATAQPAWKRVPYTWLFPRMIPMLRKKMSITDASAGEARETASEALDRIASAASRTGYLVGDRFSAADLSAAALLFPLSFPPELPFDLPDRASAVFDRWRSRWTGHPGVLWMEEIFRKHRHRLLS